MDTVYICHLPVFGPDEMWQLYFSRTKYGKGDQIRQPYSAIFCPPGRNMAAVFCPDQIRQPYSVRPDRIWQDRIFPDRPVTLKMVPPKIGPMGPNIILKLVPRTNFNIIFGPPGPNIILKLVLPCVKRSPP